MKLFTFLRRFPRTGDEGGTTKRAPSSVSCSGAAAVPAAPLSTERTHTVCGYCNAVLHGDPATVAQPGSLISTGCCRPCELKIMGAHLAGEAPVDVREMVIMAHANRVTHEETISHLQQLLAHQEEQGHPDFDAIQRAFHDLSDDATAFAQKLQQVSIALSMIELQRAHTRFRHEQLSQ